MPLTSRWRRFARLSGSKRALLLEAALRLTWARIELLVFPFRRIAARLGGVRPASGADTDTVSASRASAAHIAIVRDVAWAVPCAARHVPFDAACLPQALAARHMLARRGVPSVLHFGLARAATADASLLAHAWVDADGIEVTGYPVASQFKEVARFS
jgi:hypothetical protein